MKPETKKRINEAWDSLEDDSISTERMIQMVADHCKVETDTVIKAVFTKAKVGA